MGLQEADDALENVNLADADRKSEREKTIKRNRQPIYSALDDYEFQEGVEPGTKAPILPQYEKEKKSGKFMYYVCICVCMYMYIYVSVGILFN